jgi:ABC-type spermidine/putrescine transport system permease subunit II
MSETERSPVTFAITIAALVFLFLPLVMVVLFSFHSLGTVTFPFEGFSLRWYRETLGNEIFRSSLWNSTIVAVSVSLVTLVAGTAAAYGLTRCAPRFRPPLALLFFLPITLPGLFVGIAMLVYFARLEVQLSLTTVALAHFVYVFPYFLLVAKAALDRLDPALEEAAADLGASPWKIFRKVTLPQIWPVLAGATALAFALSFDEFIITFFVIGSDPTLPLFIFSQLRRTVDPSINVVSTMLMSITFLLWVVTFLFVVRAARGQARAEDTLLGGQAA